jgi:hypothetical protein
MAELNVLMLVCNEKFEPCALNLPYYRATNTELLRRQIEWTPEWKRAMWRQIITAKGRNQAAVVSHLKRAHTVLTEIAERCERGSPPSPFNGLRAEPRRENESDPAGVRGEATPSSPETTGATPTDLTPHPHSLSPLRGEGGPSKPSLASITASRRDAFRSHTPDACESRAARHYWKHLLPRLSEQQQTNEKRRLPGTREGVNGMLDYGYAILRTAVLRSLAAHGFIAAIGIAHAAKAGSFALADDLIEPLRPWIDRELREFLKGGERPMPEWMKHAVKVLTLEVRIGRTKVRLLNSIDLYVQSFADAALARHPLPLKFPVLP